MFQNDVRKGLMAASMLAFATPMMAQTTQPTTQPATTRPATQPATRAATQPTRHPFAASIEKTHGMEAWESKDFLRGDMVVDFGGKTIIDGSFTMTPSMGEVVIEQNAGPTVTYIDGKSWVTPNADAFPRARFHVLTWPYFLAAPFKLQDPGTKLEPMEDMPYNGVDYETAKLSFGAGVGDAPEDWYILYKHPEYDRLDAMAYIVTYSKPQEEAEKKPHAIVYEDYQVVDGVPLPMTWKFYNWSEEQSIYGDPIGEVTLSSLSFLPARKAEIEPPEDGEKVGAP